MAEIRLSPQQKRVVNHRGPRLQVIACAGSGKTESIAQRVASLILGGEQPSSIVAFTFTEKAAAELKDRIVRRVRGELGDEVLGRLAPMFVGTIHSYCFRILQDHVPRYGNYDVLDEHRHVGLVSREFENIGLGNLLHHRGYDSIQEFIRAVDVIGNELISAEDLGDAPIAECYRNYRQTLDRYHVLTFGLIIQCAVEVLDDPKIFKRVHEPLRHLLVDEYQDINPAQEQLIRLLAKSPVHLCVVGDDDQSIYQWRGSDVRNIVNFAKRYRGAETVNLKHNRRSRPKIIATANHFANTIEPRLPKKMLDVRDPAKHEVVFWSAETPQDEARIIADTIVQLHDRGHHYRDIGVLYRSVRTSAPPLIEELRSRGIPYSCAGRTGLFMQPEIAVFGRTFSWFVDKEWQGERWGGRETVDVDDLVEEFEAIFNRGRPINELKKYLEDWKLYQLRGTNTVSLVGDFYKLLYRLGAYAIDVDTLEGSARYGAFARFSEILADYEHVTRRGRYVEEDGRRKFRSGRDRGKPYFEGLHRYLVYYARDQYAEFEGEPAADLDAVDITTVHQAKGLEWPVVFIPALVKKRFPSGMTGRRQNWHLPENVFTEDKRHRYEGSDAEERRLFYVAMTRARDCVYMSCFHRINNRVNPSPFLADVAGDTIPQLLKLPLPQKPKATGSEETPAINVAFSDVALWQQCGHLYRLAAVFGFQQELAIELGYGKAIHHVLRHIAETARDTGTVPTGGQLAALVDQEFYLPFANLPAFERMHQAAGRLVRLYANAFEGDLQRVWAIERPFELHVDAGTVSGRADVILDEEGGVAGALAIVDYKVGDDLAREDRYHHQLAVYTAAGRAEGLNVTAAYLHDLRAGARQDVPVDDGQIQKAVTAIAAATESIRNGYFPVREHRETCGMCSHRPVCSHGIRVAGEPY